MSSFTATINNPDGPDNPSDSQPVLLVNNNSFINIWDVDHYGFNDPNGGKHDIIHIPLPQGASPGTGALEWASYTKFVSTGPGGIPSVEQFLQRPNLAVSGLDIQMSVNIPPFPIPPATITQDTGSPATHGGSTYLPGGIIMMFGIVNAANSPCTVVFPFGGFPNNAFGVQLTITQLNVPAVYANVLQGSLTKSGFTIVTNQGLNVYWLAYGN